MTKCVLWPRRTRGGVFDSEALGRHSTVPSGLIAMPTFFPGVETPGYSHVVPPGRRTLSNRTTGIPNRSAALEKNVQTPGRRLKSAQQVLEGRPFPSPDSPK